uniref:Ketoreductase domain-containing protein n=1 Tax=Kalanchoe fedtschenkoi TaxID=63787 RepID=A0A7N0U700_KALFE
MDLIHSFFNMVAVPFTVFWLCLIVPPYAFFKLCSSALGSLFKEDLAGKAVIITGASSGIGEHVAYEYARKGACLVLVARRENSLREVADNARQIGSPDVITVCADVARHDDCSRVIHDTMSHFGRLDHLVNNAGVTHANFLEEVPNMVEMRPIMDVNFWGAVYMTRLAVPYLRSTRGKIAVVSSAAAWLPIPRHTFYNASKAALVALFETLRVELGQDIAITIVTPGWVESEMTQGKFMMPGGEMQVDQELRDVQVSAFPVLSVHRCAEAIVNSVARGDRYLTEPAWFRTTYFWKVFCPEILEWIYHFMFLSSPGGSSKETPSKKILDFTGAKKLFYPDTILTHEVKTE